MVRPYHVFCAALPGVEALLAAEIRATLPKALDVQVVRGGVRVDAHRDTVVDCNIALRSCSRVLVRVGRFTADDRRSFVKGMSGLDWAPFLDQRSSVELSVDVSCRKSRLMHEGMLQEWTQYALARFAESIVEPSTGPGSSQRLVVNLFKDEVTVSVDSSGDHLHERKYRDPSERLAMPLRETAAAALHLMLGRGEGAPVPGPTCDPFCGSGTLLIEGALLAAGIAPGLVRVARGGSFALQGWPMVREADMLLETRLTYASRRAQPPPREPVFFGSDQDAGAVAVAKACAERAEVGGWIHFEHAALRDCRLPQLAPGQRGLLLSNPPYGPRASKVQSLRGLYISLGEWVRRRAPGWQAALLMPAAEANRRLMYLTRLRGTPEAPFALGGRSLQLFVVNVPQPEPAPPVDAPVDGIKALAS
jgi:putative N6-adenine-specific DNA methylase